MDATKNNGTFDEDKNTAMHFAAAKGHLNELIKEIEDGQKIDVENYLGWTPLMMATRNGHLDIVNVLLNKRADATRQNKFGGSIFLMAVASGNLEILHIILEHLLCGGVSRQSMESMVSPISISIIFNHDHIFQYLLGKKFSEDAYHPNIALTPLMFAATNDNEKFYETLILRGAKETIQTINGETAKDMLARRRGGVCNIPIEVPNQCMQHPTPNIIVYTPHPFIPSPITPSIRKSSNVTTPSPNFNFPALTPIGYCPQYFFPHNFSPSQFISPVNGYYYSDPYNSPYIQHTVMSPHLNCNIPSPCGTINIDSI